MKSEDVLDEEMESYIIYSIIYAEVHYKPGKASLKAFKFKCSKFAMMRYDFKINREKKRMREYSLAKGATNGGDLKIKSRDGYYIEDPLERLRTLELMEKIKEIITEKQYKYYHDRFIKGMFYKDIGKKHGVSRQRAQQAVASATLKLKKKLNA